METTENISLLIGKRVNYNNKNNDKCVGIIQDKVKVALPSSTNEYVIIDEYVILNDDGGLDSTYPYFIKSLILETR